MGNGACLWAICRQPGSDRSQLLGCLRRVFVEVQVADKIASDLIPQAYCLNSRPGEGRKQGWGHHGDKKRTFRDDPEAVN